MASFFHATISGLGDIKYEELNIGIEEANPLVQVLDNIEMVNIHKISSSELEDQLKSGNIDGFVNQDQDLIVDRSGINQTIIRSILEEIKQVMALDLDWDSLDFEAKYISSRQKQDRAFSGFS